MNIKDCIENKELEMAKLIFAEQPTTLEAMAEAIKRADSKVSEAIEKYNNSVKHLEALCKLKLKLICCVDEDLEKIKTLNTFKDSSSLLYLKLYYAGNITFNELVNALNSSDEKFKIDITKDRSKVTINGYFSYRRGRFDVYDDIDTVTTRVAENSAYLDICNERFKDLEKEGVLPQETIDKIVASYERKWSALDRPDENATNK